jgi:Na+-transporting NADH:ubiquinone oxidoreductase subunit NqrE
VKSYIFVPCVVYGEGKGFGNKISIQDVAIVKAALAAGRVYKVDDGNPVRI